MTSPGFRIFLETTDRLSEKIKEHCLDVGAYKHQLKLLAKTLPDSIMKIEDVISVNNIMLSKIICSGYCDLVTKFVFDNKFTSLDEMIKAKTMEKIIKFDLFVYSINNGEYIDMHLIVDVYPDDIGYIPFFNKRSSPKFIETQTKSH